MRVELGALVEGVRVAYFTIERSTGKDVSYRVRRHPGGFSGRKGIGASFAGKKGDEKVERQQNEKKNQKGAKHSLELAQDLPGDGHRVAKEVIVRVAAAVKFRRKTPHCGGCDAQDLEDNAYSGRMAGGKADGGKKRAVAHGSVDDKRAYEHRTGNAGEIDEQELFHGENLKGLSHA